MTNLSTDALKADTVKESPDPKLLQTLVCPVTKSSVTYDATENELISEKAGLAYPIRYGIPIMLESEARQLPKP